MHLAYSRMVQHVLSAKINTRPTGIAPVLWHKYHKYYPNFLSKHFIKHVVILLGTVIRRSLMGCNGPLLAVNSRRSFIDLLWFVALHRLVCHSNWDRWFSCMFSKQIIWVKGRTPPSPLKGVWLISTSGNAPSQKGQSESNRDTEKDHSQTLVSAVTPYRHQAGYLPIITTIKQTTIHITQFVHLTLFYNGFQWKMQTQKNNMEKSINYSWKKTEAKHRRDRHAKWAFITSLKCSCQTTHKIRLNVQCVLDEGHEDVFRWRRSDWVQYGTFTALSLVLSVFGHCFITHCLRLKSVLPWFTSKQRHHLELT